MSADSSVPPLNDALPKVSRRQIPLQWDTVLTVGFLLIGAAVMIAPFAWIMQVAFSGSARAYQPG